MTLILLTAGRWAMTNLCKSGGEGGIRTLGTGFSPYNGLANESFSSPSLVFNNLPDLICASIGRNTRFSILKHGFDSR